MTDPASSVGFDGTKHPRGQPDNPGKFRRRGVPTPPLARRRQPRGARVERSTAAPTRSRNVEKTGAGCELCGVKHRGRCRRSALESSARSWAASHRRMDDPARDNGPGAAGPNPYACDLCGLPHNRSIRCRRSALESAAKARAAANAPPISAPTSEPPDRGARDPYACGHCHRPKHQCRCRPRDRIWY